MSRIEDLLAIDPSSAEDIRAVELALSDYRLLRDLIKVRKDRRLSQDDLAVILGISQPSVAAFERVDADPKLSTIRRYALAVGAAIDHQVVKDGDQLWSGIGFRIPAALSAKNLSRSSYKAAVSKKADFAIAA